MSAERVAPIQRVTTVDLVVVSLHSFIANMKSNAETTRKLPAVQDASSVVIKCDDRPLAHAMRIVFEKEVENLWAIIGRGKMKKRPSFDEKPLFVVLDEPPVGRN